MAGTRTRVIASVWTMLVGQDFWWVLVLKCAVLVLFLATCFAYLTLAERKVSARIQLRYGPNRVGPFGLLQPAADGLKLFFKENTAPAGRDRFLYLLGPSLAGGAAMLAYALVPLGDNSWFGYAFHWGITNFNVGLLFILGITSLGVYSLFLGGWSANSKYSLLGGLRSSAQLISYEMAVAFALMGVVILSGSLNLQQIVGAQRPLWFVVLQPLGFILYFTGAFAETNRLPFDLPEAETELVGGYHTEYSSMRFGLYFLGEYVNMVTVCSIATALFLGGSLTLIPVHPFDWIPGPLWFLGKVAVLLFIMMWVRWTLPRLRYDRLMNFGWKVLLPLGLLNIVITGAVVALRAA
jgi:NADH-quinone oxidoreductase subunit H